MKAVRGPLQALRRNAADPRGMPTIILFQRGSATLSAAYRDALRRHVLYLDSFGLKALFVLRGHANLRTNEAGAVTLSRRRAATVAAQLRSLGVAKGRIRVLAQGSARSWDVQMGGETPLKWNRRVEINIVLPPARTARAGKAAHAARPTS